MSLEGRINVDVLVHDRSGTASVKILSLASSKSIASGEAVIVTGTSDGNYQELTYANYRNAAGELVDLNSVYRIAFAWSGTNTSILANAGDELMRLYSSGGEVAVSALNGEAITPAIYPNGTGTYTVILWGDT